MSRNISEATKKDFDWLKLQREIREIIKTKKEWSEFKKYMSVYFK